MEQPVFTIIMPTFNSGKTIRRALDSVLGQTFTQFEILVMDGISKDDTVEIIRGYADKDQRIHFLSEKDDGIYDAMNKGIHRAMGEWLYFLGSDDRLLDKSVLEKIYKESLRGNYNLLYGYIISEKDGRYGGPASADEIIKNNISHQAMFFNKKIFKELGDYNINYKTHADWDFNLRLFGKNAATLHYIDIPIAHYASGGLSSTHETSFLRDTILPLRLNQLTKDEYAGPRSLSWFDEWWRFIRNAKIKTVGELVKLAGNEKIPFPVTQIVHAQEKLSQSTLANRFSSKFFMSLAYSRYLFSRILNKI